MSNGQRLAVDPSVSSMDDIASQIKFGLYDSLLEAAKLPVLVISSMGAQSTGKSYQLNHLGGTLFDVSGQRCTDGIWMSMRAVELQVWPACSLLDHRLQNKISFILLAQRHAYYACKLEEGIAQVQGDCLSILPESCS